MVTYNEQGDLGSTPSFDAKVDTTPLIKEQALDRRYAVNWNDHTETDGEYIWSETKKWLRKERDG